MARTTISKEGITGRRGTVVPPGLLTSSAPVAVVKPPVVASKPVSPAPIVTPKVITKQPVKQPVAAPTPITKQPVKTTPMPEEVVDLTSSFDIEAKADPFAIEQTTIDINKPIATNKYGGALKYSELSDEDKAIVDARKAAGLTTDTYQGVQGQDYGAAAEFETPDQALSNYSNFFNDLQQQQAATSEEYNLLNYDPGEFVRAGFSPAKGSVAAQAGAEKAIDYLTKNKIPMSKEIDGKTYYLTTGLGEDVLSKTLGDEYVGEGSYEAYGEPGTYSTVYVEPESVLNNPVLNLAATLVPGGSLALTALKAATGETLHGMDYLSAGLDGLKISGSLKAPVDAAEAAQAGTDALNAANAAGLSSQAAFEAANAAQDAALAGKGLAGLSYGQSVGLLKAAATGDLKEAAASLLAPTIIDNSLKAVGFSTDNLANTLNVNRDDLEAGLSKTIGSLAGGADFKEALTDGFVEYVKEGGGLNIDVPGLDSLEKWAKEISGGLIDVVKEAGSAFDDEVLQPIKKAIPPEVREAGKDLEDFIRETGSATEDVVREAGSTIDDAVIQPIREASKVIDDEVIQPVREVGKKLDDVVGGFLKGLVAPALGAALGQGMLSASMPSPTRTTDQLFNDELFKFKTEIDVNLEPIQYVDLTTTGFEESPDLSQRYFS